MSIFSWTRALRGAESEASWSVRKLRRTLLTVICFCPLIASAGLDVTAYTRLAPVASPQLDQDGEPIGEKQVMLVPVEFVERFTGLTPNGVYRYEAAFEFRAGSYSGYNHWRNELARLAGYAATPDTLPDGKIEMRYDATVWRLQKGPFWELIDFSDSEGVIGPVVCKRVYADFVQYHHAALQHPDENFRAAYAEWMKAFAMCADEGAIVFH